MAISTEATEDNDLHVYFVHFLKNTSNSTFLSILVKVCADESWNLELRYVRKSVELFICSMNLQRSE